MSQKVLSKELVVPEGATVVPDRFDVRVIAKNLSLGRVSLDEFQKHLDSLPDSEADAEKINYTELLDSEDSTSSDEDESDSTKLSFGGLGRETGGASGALQ